MLLRINNIFYIFWLLLNAFKISTTNSKKVKEKCGPWYAVFESIRSMFKIIIWDNWLQLYETIIDPKSHPLILVDDTSQPGQQKRWVVVSPKGAIGATLLIAQASKSEQKPFIGNQTGGKVFLYLRTDNFWEDYNNMISNDIKFIENPKIGLNGTIEAIFEDLYGTLWCLSASQVEEETCWFF
jgi:hypothetical protein